MLYEGKADMTSELVTTKAGGALAEVTATWLAEIPNENTRVSYTSALAHFVGWLGSDLFGERWTLDDIPVNLGSAFGAKNVKRYLEALLADGKSKSTANHRLYVIRKWTRHLVDLEAMHPSRSAAILALPSYRHKNRIHRTYLTDAEVQQLLDSIPGGREAELIDVRDRALLALLAWTGLRRSELCAANVGDFQKQNSHYLLNDIERKGGLVDFVKLQPPLAAAISKWLDLAGIVEVTEPLFQSVNKSGDLMGKRLTGEAIRLIVRKRLERAGLPLMSPHALRRSWCTNALAAGASLEAVRVGGGWSNFGMITKYNQGRQSLDHNATDALSYEL